ncbi:extracellular elastinolytic metalloproteinase [Coprinopsis cinerea AmutBmut pab1-1]|nr:extracellular elastinolytic metalloproteinase [Coprinopsis cinerea AmutBmut pab1-1]
MARFHTLLSSVLTALALVSHVRAGPAIAGHGLGLGRRQALLDLQIFKPETIFETYGEGETLVDGLLGSVSDITQGALNFVADRLGIDPAAVRYRSGFTSEIGTQHGYLHQVVNDIPVANAVANVAFKDNKVVSFGSSFVDTTNIASPTPTIDLPSILPTIEETLNGKYNGHPTKLEYLVLPDGSLALAHVAQIENEEEDTFYEAFVDAHTGELIGLVDFTADASYRVLPIHKQAFPQGQEFVVNPEDILASPLGWHDPPFPRRLRTSGNNVLAENSSLFGNEPSTESAPGIFNYAYDASRDPTVQSNVDAARTNAFYVINTVHDFTYRYGFTEAAYNFQQDNYGKGGKGGDRVMIGVQDAMGRNNAVFATPPDGQPGRCRMYIFDLTNPHRDSTFQNDIVVHEMGHGISNRLVGGGTARCLQTPESRGLGEGWSDALAEWTNQTPAMNDYVLGTWVLDNTGGVRKYPYSINASTNPLTYGSGKNADPDRPHDRGEIWANTLHNVMHALVQEHGWSHNARTNPDTTEGNVVWMHLFIDSFSLMPCNPTFLSARDAWIQADQNRYAGANKCLLWRVFASKGMGVDAKAEWEEDFSLPDDC